MDKKSFAIGLLCGMAMLLLAADFAPKPARADFSIKDRDFQVATAAMAAGGDALYVIDNNTGNVGVFSYNTTTKSLQIRNVSSLDGLVIVPQGRSR